MAATQPEQPLPARSGASRAQRWGAKLGPFLLGLWIALFASMCPAAEAKIRGVARALGLEPQGEVLVQTVRSRVERALAGIPAGAGPRVLFLMGLQHGAPLTAGEGTSAQAMIELAGGANALQGFSGYRPVSPEALAEARPEVLLVPEHVLGAMGGAEGIPGPARHRADLRGAPAAPRGHGWSVPPGLRAAPRGGRHRSRAGSA